MNHIPEDDLILLHYGDPGVSPELRAHLDSCPECRRAASSLADTLNLCNEWQVPEPAPGFERGIWAQIVPHMESPRRTPFAWWKIAGALTATAALLIAAFVAGRVSFQPKPSITAGLSHQARQRILAISLADHLDRAEMLLTEISNARDTDTGLLADDRARAQDLVDEGRLMRQTLALRGPTSTLSLLDDVERFMLEVANSPETLTPVDVRALRERIGSDSLLFKVRIIESNLRTEGQKS
ncbi:MAG: hypothetical protein KGN84_12550 [Acidobacteriota bacterium]|nr:hypothetical protein [Acidobacteriota bacterium]